MNVIPARTARSESRRLPLWAFMLLYLSQSTPVALALVAIPAGFAVSHEMPLRSNGVLTAAVTSASPSPCEVRNCELQQEDMI
jgi:hypothetical protein